MTDPANTPATGETGTSGNSAAGLYAFADCELISINNGMMLVINRLNGNQQMMAPQVVEGLKTCTGFETLETHASQLAATRPELQNNPAMALSVLQNLQAAGMLLPATTICERLAEPAPRRLPPTRAFVITCDRPAAVQRLLESLLQAGRLSQHDALFLVDDSREPANRAANREAVIQFNQRSARDMFYLGAEEQQALMSALSDALPTHATGIRFLLDPQQWRGKKTFGRSRTLCLLLSVGYRALVMDDDIICRAMLPPVSEEGIGIGSGAMRQAAFYESEQALFAGNRRADFDPLSGHATLLGSSLGQTIAALNNGPLQEKQLHHTNAALANVLRADSPVLISQCGSLGDPGTGPHWGAHLGEQSVERLLAAPHGMTDALENRLNWLGSARPNLFKMPFMSQLTGLDNSRLLPPYFPAFRGEDALFGAMLVSLHPSSVALEYPWSVPHLPLEPRRSNLREPIAGSSGGISLLARYLSQGIDYRDATDPGARLQAMAADALRIAARDDANLLLDYRTELARGHADQLHIFAAKLERAQRLPSTDWQQYLRRGVDEVQRALTHQHNLTAIEGVAQGASNEQLLAEFRDMARGFAAALAGWVETRDVASRIVDEWVAARKLLPV